MKKMVKSSKKKTLGTLPFKLEILCRGLGCRNLTKKLSTISAGHYDITNGSHVRNKTHGCILPKLCLEQVFLNPGSIEIWPEMVNAMWHTINAS